MAKQVILLPGICGSELWGVGADGKGVQVWMNNTRLALLGPGDLQLAANGIDPGPLASGDLTPKGYVRIGLYEPLQRQLELDGWTVRTIGYDWRKSILQQAPLVRDAIRTVFPSDDFYVIGHSMGGLLARAVYPIFGDAFQKARWKRTVYLGTPHGGAHAAAASVTSLEFSGSPLWQVALVFQLARNLLPVLPGGKGRLADQVNAVVASWPGLFELLPALGGPWTDADPQAGALFDKGRYTSWNPYVTQARLDAARTTIETLTQGIGAPAPEQLCVVGTGFLTPQKVADPAQLGDDAGYTWSNDGDGTVSLLRGQLPTAKLVTYQGGHQGYLQDRFPLSSMNVWLTFPLDPIPDKIVGPTPPVGTIEGPPAPIVRPDLAWPGIVRRGDP